MFVTVVLHFNQIFIINNPLSYHLYPQFLHSIVFPRFELKTPTVINPSAFLVAEILFTLVEPQVGHLVTQIIYKLSSSELLSSDFFIGSVAAPSSIPSETSAIIKQIQDVPINERFLLWVKWWVNIYLTRYIDNIPLQINVIVCNTLLGGRFSFYNPISACIINVIVSHNIKNVNSWIVLQNGVIVVLQ